MSCNHHNDTESIWRLLGRETAGSILKWNYDIIIACCQWKKEYTKTCNWKFKIDYFAMAFYFPKWINIVLHPGKSSEYYILHWYLNNKCRKAAFTFVILLQTSRITLWISEFLLIFNQKLFNFYAIKST